MKKYNKSQVTQKKIIDVATKLFFENECNDVSVSKICSLAGVSTGSFYHQIGSKENLIKITYETYIEESVALLEKMKDSSAIEKIKFVIDRYISHTLIYGYKYYKYFFKLGLENKLPLRKEGTPTMYSYIKKYTELGVSKKEFNSKYSSDEIYKTILSAARGSVYEWCLSEGTLDLKAGISLHLKILFDEFQK